ncbi:hypothetical protein QKU58_gp129 [Pyramimonas orientalis virus]|uniref:Uncharacterized protein n=1 Tax=Pyramimonas orientalis virus 01B TaxID=3134525 RepID=A0A7M3UNF1_9VIRU|nr:hypothetical protein QKU58_gp129 [Pyramimonas orientalis virus]QOI90202.1 hypothetical protein HWQ62_00065 [Pyramimonas orientalis virus]
MAFLQVKNNLGDIHNVCEAQNNLGLLNMAYQCKCNVDIKGGNIVVSSIRLNDANVDSNYVLVAKNNLGDVMWKEQVHQAWMDLTPGEIQLSTLCNDINFIKQDDINISISTYIEENRSNIINPDLTLESLFLNDLHITGSIGFDPDGVSPIDVPCVLTNNGSGCNVVMTPIEQTYTSDSMSNVCSAKAVSNLYNKVVGVESRLPEEGATYMTSSKNFDEVGIVPIVAVSNLGLNDNFYTQNLTLSNVSFFDSTRPPNIINTDYFMMRRGNDMVFWESILIADYTSRSEEYPPSATSVNNLYNNLTSNIDTKLSIDNVLSEIVEDYYSSEDDAVITNPYRAIFKERLETTGVKEVAFTSDWYDLLNRPTRLSGFSNKGEMDETLFIYARSNLADLTDAAVSRQNLGLHNVAHTGLFRDLLLPSSILQIVADNDAINIEGGIPFFIRNCNLSELNTTYAAAAARSNLGLGDMSTLHKSNVDITGGDITVTSCHVESSFKYEKVATSIEFAGTPGNNVYLKCKDSYGLGEWTYLPEAATISSTQGIVYITNDLKSSASNAAITAYAISNAFHNQSNLSNLVPLASHSSVGIVTTTNDYNLSEPKEHIVLSAIGSINLYNEIQSNIGTVTTLANTKVVAITSRNFTADNEFLTISDVSVGDDVIKEIGLNYPTVAGKDELYLCGDGTFRQVIPTTLTKGAASFSKNIVISGDDEAVLFTKGVGGADDEIRFQNDIYTQGNGIEINGANVITNTGVHGTDNTYILMNSFNVITTTGAYVGTTPGHIVGHSTDSGKFLQCTSENSFSFQEVDLSEFIGGVKGLVPSITDATGVTDTNRVDHYLNGLGQWIINTEVVDIDDILAKLEENAFVNTVSIQTSNIDIFQITNNSPTKSNSGDVIIGLIGGSEKQVISKSIDTNHYVWKDVIDVLISKSSNVIGLPNSLYLNKEGNFTLPPTSRNFTVDFSLNTSNITIEQRLDEVIPDGTQTSMITITDASVGGLRENYIHNKQDVIYWGGANRLYMTVDGITTNWNSLSLINATFEFGQNSKDVLTGAAMKQYIDWYVDDFTENNSSTSVFSDDKYFTTLALSNYVENLYINNTDRMFKDDFENVNNGVYEDKVILAGTLSNYINTQMVFDSELTLPANNSKLVRSLNVLNLLGDNRYDASYAFLDFENEDFKFATPKAVASYTSNYASDLRTHTGNYLGDFFSCNDFKFVTPKVVATYVSSNFVNSDEKFGINDVSSLVNNDVYKNRVVIANTLSNYINSTLDILDGTSLSHEPSMNKLVRPKNVINYLDTLRTTSGHMNDFNNDDDVKFTTPKALKTYVSSNFVNSDEKFGIDEESRVNNEDYKNRVVIANTLSNYINKTLDIVNGTSLSYEPSMNKLVRPKNVINYLDTLRTTSGDINDFNNDDDVKFTTPKVVKTYVTNEFTSKIRLTNTTGNFDTDDVRVVTGSAVANFLDTSFLRHENKLPIANVTDVIDEDPDLVDYVITSETLVKFMKLSRTVHDDDVVTAMTDNLKLITPKAVAEYAESTFLNLNKLYFNTGHQPVLNVYQNLNPDDDNKVFTVKAISNLLFNTTTGSTNGGLVQNEDTFFVNNRVMSSATMSNYIDNTYIPRTAVTSTASGGSLDMIPNLEGTLSNIYYHIYDVTSTALNLEGLEPYDAGSDPTNPTYLVDEATLSNVLTNSYQKINNVDGNLYSYNTSSPDEKDKNMIPTVGFMEQSVSNQIRTQLSTGAGINFDTLAVSQMTVEQEMFLPLANTGRDAVVADQMFMTIDSTGEVYFKRVDHIAGDGSNVNTFSQSLATGKSTITFNSNQVVCGAFNEDRNIYDTLTPPYNNTNDVNFVVGVGNGIDGDAEERMNGFEVHNTGEVFVRSNLILGENWRISFDTNTLCIEKYDSTTSSYIQKHIFK